MVEEDQAGQKDRRPGIGSFLLNFCSVVEGEDQAGRKFSETTQIPKTTNATTCLPDNCVVMLSGYQDSNLGPPAPKAVCHIILMLVDDF